MLQKLTKYGKYVVYGLVGAAVAFFAYLFTNNSAENALTKKEFNLNQKTEATHGGGCGRGTHCGDDGDGGN